MDVTIHEMRGVRPTAVHKTDALAELVCSNSFRADKIDNAVGLIKEEMRRLGSIVMRAADVARVPAGAALAVDRHVFSETVTKAVQSHPRIRDFARRSAGRARPRMVAGDYRHRSADLRRVVAEHPADGRRGTPRVLRRDQSDRAGRIDRHVEGVPRVALGPQRLEPRTRRRRSNSRTKAIT